MKIRKWLTAAVALLLLTAMFFGCNHATGNEEETTQAQNAGNAVTLKINGVELSEYTVVHSKKIVERGSDTLAYFNQKVGDLYGVNLEGATASEDRYEIVVGPNCGDAAIAEAFQASPDGFIGVSGKKIFLLGANYGAVCQVIDAFLAKVQGDGTNKTITVAANESVAVRKDALKVMSYNVLQDFDKEGRADEGETDEEKYGRFISGLQNTIREQDPDVFGTQETTSKIHDEILSKVEGYTCYKGLAHYDDTYLGNYVYYKTDKFKAVEKGHQFMSDTPNSRSKYSDSNAYRGFTYVLLESKETGNRFLFISVHTDYRGPVDKTTGESNPTGEAATAVRTKQLKVLTAFLKKTKWVDYPAVIVGDFNDTPGKDSITSFQEDNPRLGMTSKVAETKGDTGGTLVTTGFTRRDPYVFDYIFVSRDQISTLYYTVVNNIDQTSGKAPSDHLPVLAEIVLY